MIPKQNTPEWLEWRKDKIGASDAPIILGLSPWTTPFQLWQTKLGLKPNIEETESMRRGKILEPVALEMFNEKEQVNLKPAVLVDKDHEWQIASLDGYDTKVFCEIKCPGFEDHESAIKGKIPSKYVPQVVHQLMVSRCEKGFYVSYSPAHDVKLVVIPFSFSDFDLDHLHLFEKEHEFMLNLRDFEPPELCEKDYNVLNDYDSKILASQWKELDQQEKYIKEKKTEIKNLLLNQCEGQSSICDGLKMQKIYRRGNIEYGRISLLEGLNLDEFRKPSYETWRFITDERKT